MTGERLPKGLGPAGRDLWRKVQASFELDSHELPGLLLACRQLDDVTRLEALLERDGIVSVGSTGQLRLSQVVAELRQSRLAASKLLDALALPVDDTGVAATPAAKRARRAAQSRWAGHVPTRDRAGGASPCRAGVRRRTRLAHPCQLRFRLSCWPVRASRSGTTSPRAPTGRREQ